jgi:hypothetical protein
MKFGKLDLKHNLTGDGLIFQMHVANPKSPDHVMHQYQDGGITDSPITVKSSSTVVVKETKTTSKPRQSVLDVAEEINVSYLLV